jgi:hypothetical protein
MIQNKNYICVTPNLIFVLFALRHQLVYYKVYIRFLYDELKIIGYRINVHNSKQLKAENIFNYNHDNSISHKVLKLREL